MTESARQIREGNPRALARTATGIENRDPQALATLRDLTPFACHAKIVGITGAPGAGKSTLVDALATAIRRQGKTLAILAVDPTSGISGGAILGDRIRMQQHHADPGIFIRSMATRGSLGGLARATADLAQLMDAAGKDYVLIETVGVGQAEISIAQLAQVTVVVLVPGMGDDVQAIKAGILEIADIFAINKSDQPGADRVEQELEAMLSLTDARQPAIVKTVATTGEGIDALLNAIQSQVGRTPTSAPDPQVRPAPAERSIAIHLTNLEDVLAHFQSAGSQIQSNSDGHILIQPPPGVILELIEEAVK
jgi:LAO/AO transport system kinase